MNRLPARCHIITMLLGSLLLSGCAVRSQTPEPGTQAVTTNSDPKVPPQTREVTIDNFTYGPQALTVPVGTKVTWLNRDDVPHTVTSSTKPRLLDSPALDTDQTFSHVFTTPGTFEYFCTVHPKMTGKVIVK